MAPISSHHNVGAGRFNQSSLRSELIQINSDVALAIALYSASVLDLANVTCFFELQEMRLLPRYTRNPLVERRSRESPAQSASLKDVREIGDVRLK